MKEIRLSGRSERITAWLVTALLTALLLFLLRALRNDPSARLLLLLIGLVVLAATLFYLLSVIRAACIVSDGQLEIAGIIRYAQPLDGVSGVRTQGFSSGPVARRSIVLTDEQGRPAYTIPTFFTARGGAMAEPAAQELAAALDLPFAPSLEPWEYDRQARREHRQAMAEAERKQRRERRAARKARRRGETPPQPEKKPAEAVNYDALDDER
ncbi:MAG: hypothetical protein IJV41_02270 [Oscillospiraceae bacterium]|nr:hypothetical protein [Oscillospiraceae bacterium]